MNFGDNRRRVIATYGIFSMEGDVAPSKEICDLADRCNAHVFVDECHATDSALTLLVLEFIDTFRFGRSIKVLDLLSSSSEFTTSLKSNISNFRKSLTDAGFKVIGNPSYPICPVFLDDTSYPVTSKGKTRIHVQISAGYTKQQIDQCTNAFKEIGKKLGVI
ncbi:hypothetical protein X798_04835 [Onchocerca flexuosa]|uniref:Aminotransferase class I/classII large domain-containing protein n=1 Tax=Onchocerca flexuosa TaxID=387005 RepID=A0A238BSC0_9BILA|nr:hypothetical protein X798_04835 [Onchocerca flexuosa]